MNTDQLNDIFFGLMKAHFISGAFCLLPGFFYFLLLNRKWGFLRKILWQMTLYVSPAFSFIAVFIFICTSNDCLHGSDDGGGRFSLLIVMFIVLGPAAAFWFTLIRFWVRAPERLRGKHARKIVLHCPKGYRPELEKLVELFLADGVVSVGVVGEDCVRVKEKINELVVGDGSDESRFILTASHPGATVEEALKFSRSMSGYYEGKEVQLVAL